MLKEAPAPDFMLGLNPLAVTNKGSSDGKGQSAGASAEFTSFPRLSHPQPKSPKTGVPGLLPESPYRGCGYNFFGKVGPRGHERGSTARKSP